MDAAARGRPRVAESRPGRPRFQLTIDDGVFSWSRRPTAIARERALDGIYVIRTSQSEQEISAADAVRKYKSLATVERAFRCLMHLLEGQEFRPVGPSWAHRKSVPVGRACRKTI